MMRKQVSEFRRLRVNRPSQRSYTSPLSARSGDQRAEVLIVEENDLRNYNYLRAPYDPFYGAQAARYMMRGVLHAATVAGFPRFSAVIVLCCAAIGCILGASLAVRALIVRDGMWGASLIWTAFFTFMLGALAFALLSRLGEPNQRT